MEQLIKIIEESLYEVEPGSITEESNVVQLKEWDSLALLTVTDAVDLEFGVLLKKDEIEASGTVLKLYQLILSKQK
tara:strand:+ start:886 stop:1113 length:228 start_codon:yes stop_codon:yes gene_type:complete